MVRRIFRRKKKKERHEEQPEEVRITDLEKICGDDKEVCKALLHTMFLDPRKVQVTLDDVLRTAVDFEKKGNSEQAKIWYHVAGGLALWRGDVAKVKLYFGKCAKLAPEMDYELITKIPERAVEIARKYYEKFLR